jgi:hypothetical protein
MEVQLLDHLVAGDADVGSKELPDRSAGWNYSIRSLAAHRHSSKEEGAAKKLSRDNFMHAY